MWKELTILVSLCFALPFCSSSVLDAADDQAAMISWPPRPLVQGYSSNSDYFMNEPKPTPPPRCVSLIFLAATMICFPVFIATYCMAYRAILARTSVSNDQSYQDRFGAEGEILDEEQSRQYEAGREAEEGGGLEASIVESLPVVQYTTGMIKEGTAKHWKGLREVEQKVQLQVEECVVCLSEYEEGEELKVLPVCGHSFHKACVNMWLFSHTTCPICRLPLRKQHIAEERRHTADRTLVPN